MKTLSLVLAILMISCALFGFFGMLGVFIAVALRDALAFI